MIIKLIIKGFWKTMVGNKARIICFSLILLTLASQNAPSFAEAKGLDKIRPKKDNQNTVLQQ